MTADANPADGEARIESRFSKLAPEIVAKLSDVFSQGTCSPRDIDDKVIHQLQALTTSDGVDAILKLESAVRTSEVRNVSAYLAGVIRRLTQVPAGSGFSDSGPGGAGGDAPLAPPAQDVLERLYASGAVRRGDLDSRSLRNLASKPAEIQVLVMETFRDRNLRGIRNMAAFFTSHQTQVERDLRDGVLRPPRLGPPPPHHHGGYYPPPEHRPYEPLPPGPHPGGPYGGPPPHQPGYPPHPQQNLPPPGTYGAPPPHPSQLPPQQQQQQYAPTPGYAPAPAPAAAPTPMAPAVVPQPKHYALEQVQWGVRVDEFQGLSPFAKFVHPAAALRLQQLWDVDQNKLVSVLNEASWEALAGLDAQASVNAVDETAQAMRSAPDDLTTINSIFLTAAAKFPKRPEAPTLATVTAIAVAPAAAPLPMLQQQPAAAAAAPLYPVAMPPLAQAGPYGAPPSQQQRPLPYGGPPPQYGGPGREPPPGYGMGPPLETRPPVHLPGPAGTLPQPLQVCIDRMLNQWSGKLKLDHFDPKCIDMLHRVGEGNALHALEDFGRNNPAQMRNVTAYLIGCLRKYDDGKGEREGGRGGDRDRQGPPARGGRGGGRGRGRDGRDSRRYEPY